MTPLKQSYWCSLSALLLRNFRETVAENPLQINQKNHTLNCVSGFSSTWVVLTWVYSMPVINRSNVLPSPRKTNENKRLSRFSHLIKNIKINFRHIFRQIKQILSRTQKKTIAGTLHVVTLAVFVIPSMDLQTFPKMCIYNQTPRNSSLLLGGIPQASCVHCPISAIGPCQVRGRSNGNRLECSGQKHQLHPIADSTLW